MDLTGALDILKDAGEAMDLLDQGTPAIIDYIAGMADEWLQDAIPAYGTAVAACGAVPGCKDKLIEARNAGAEEICRRTGIYGLIDDLVDAWNSLPGAARDALRLLGHLEGAIVQVFAAALSALGPVVTAVWDGIKAGASWVAKGVSKLFNAAAQSVEDTFNTLLPGTDANIAFISNLGMLLNPATAGQALVNLGSNAANTIGSVIDPSSSPIYPWNW